MEAQLGILKLLTEPAKQSFLSWKLLSVVLKVSVWPLEHCVHLSKAFALSAGEAIHGVFRSLADFCQDKTDTCRVGYM